MRKRRLNEEEISQNNKDEGEKWIELRLTFELFGIISEGVAHVWKDIKSGECPVLEKEDAKAAKSKLTQRRVHKGDQRRLSCEEKTSSDEWEEMKGGGAAVWVLKASAQQK